MCPHRITKEVQFIILFLLCSGGFLCGPTVGMPGAVIDKDVPVTTAQPVSVIEKEPLKLPLKDPRIVVNKRERRLDLDSAGAVVRRYRIGLGPGPVEDKIRQGDRRTPEGEF